MSADLADIATVAIAARIRKLPVVLVRVLLMLDLALFFIPFWGWFAYRRWSGRNLTAAQFRPIYTKGCRFAVKHIMHTGGGTGPLSMSWTTPTVRKAPLPERLDFPTPGSCGTCKNCCTTHWLPPAEREACGFLGEKGCTIYGGMWWDHFNCGRYPADFPHTQVYDCRRFGITPAEYFETPAPEPRRRSEERAPAGAA